MSGARPSRSGRRAALPPLRAVALLLVGLLTLPLIQALPIVAMPFATLPARAEAESEIDYFAELSLQSAFDPVEWADYAPEQVVPSYETVYWLQDPESFTQRDERRFVGVVMYNAKLDVRTLCMVGMQDGAWRLSLANPQAFTATDARSLLFFGKPGEVTLRHVPSEGGHQSFVFRIEDGVWRFAEAYCYLPSDGTEKPDTERLIYLAPKGRAIIATHYIDDSKHILGIEHVDDPGENTFVATNRRDQRLSLRGPLTLNQFDMDDMLEAVEELDPSKK